MCPCGARGRGHVGELDQLARDWLTYWLLDRDARGFEQQVADLVLPDQFRLSSLS
jgi:hypothetical protein